MTMSMVVMASKPMRGEALLRRRSQEEWVYVSVSIPVSQNYVGQHCRDAVEMGTVAKLAQEQGELKSQIVGDPC